MTKRVVAIIVAIVIIFFLACGGYQILSSNITRINSTTSVGEIGNIILSFTSIAVTLFLGIIVYFQSERINTLEASQYDVFLGVEKIGDATSFPSGMIEISENTNNLNLYAKLFETMHNDELELYAHIQMSTQTQNTFLSLIFVTRNVVLITSLCFKGISVQIETSGSNNQDAKLCKNFIINAIPVCRFLTDNSRFLFGISLHGVDKSKIEKIHISIDLVAEDQFGRSHSSKVEFNMVKIDEELCLISSKSKSKK